MGRKTGKTDLASKAKYGKNDYPLVFMAHYFRYVEGLPDDVAIFNRALTEGDIAKIMNGLKQNVLSVSVKDKPRRGFSVCYTDGTITRIDNPDHKFPIIFGEGAMKLAG